MKTKISDVIGPILIVFTLLSLAVSIYLKNSCLEGKVINELNSENSTVIETVSRQKLSLYLGDIYVGTVGFRTSLVDIDNTPLYVGDVVEVSCFPFGSIATSYVCHNDEYGDYIMGIAENTSTRLGRKSRFYVVRKIKDYKELKDGDIFGDVLVCKTKE